MDAASFINIIGFGPEGWGKVLLLGALLTIALAICGFFLGAVIGILAAWAKLSGGRILRIIAETYTTVIRGIPDLLVIYLFYFGGSSAVTAIGRYFGSEGFIGFPGFLAGVLAIAICSGALHTEVFRGAYKAIPSGEIEAATASGMSIWIKFRRIIAPLAFRYALPGFGNVWQVALKESALVSIVGIIDLMQQAKFGAGNTGLHFQFYIIAAAIYLLISTVSGSALQISERIFSRGMRRSR
ncbi:ABC transporter permease [Bartonella sp. HY761]|uniref:ABC transporter permease n=1 Tax=Bartonella sp. HY761 TaxID=2979330 RepID=UPI00220A2131|nr:ABC transporter permease subunit [Bartonella sp. HY761]UXN06605.1 ABC transporter permease subunit [Bartonella sp. HY761]